MSEPSSQADLPKNATAEEIEADIAETRARLSESVDALAAKVDVKAQAKEKADEAKEQAKEKVGQAKQQVVATTHTVLDRFKAASRPVQVAIGAAPLALLILVIVRRARR